MTELLVNDVPIRPRLRHRRYPLMRFVLRRLLAGALTLFAASIVIFVGTSAIPGSPASAALGRAAPPEVIAELDQRLGYDQPVASRYLDWLGGAVQGDLGNSAIEIAQGASEAPIWPIIRSPLLNTATLAVITIVLLIPLALLLGAWAGIQAGRWQDHVISTVTLALMALPEFVVASGLVVVFFVNLDVLPPVSLVRPGESPLANPEILVLPVMTLLLVSVAWATRLVRVGTIEVLRTDYVRMARLSGIDERKVLRRYALRNALAPSVQVFALSIQYLFGGVIVTEAVFNYPGLGKQLVDAVAGHDNTQVQAIALILATIYIGINIVADVMVVVLVPKLRTEM